VLREVCERTDITAGRIMGVSTFYSQFRHEPAGEHRLCVCVGTACHVKGAARTIDAFRRHLKIEPGRDTDPTGTFTLEPVACLGCCTLAPVVQIGASVYGHVHPPDVSRVVNHYLAAQKRRSRATRPRKNIDASPAGEIRIGLGSCCQARGSATVQTAVERAIEQTGRAIRLKPVGCVGICSQTPLLEIVTPSGASTLYTQVQRDQVRDIVRRHFPPAGLWRRTRGAVATGLEKLLTDESWDEIERFDANHRDEALDEFLGPQKHIATERCGELDPLDLDEYRRGGGFTALEKALGELSAEAVIEQVRAAGLRGRGGAGFPTGQKWATVRVVDGDTKYIVCNGDEGDPGAFMDRMLLESYPFRVLEGIAIAATAVGAQEGILYIRAEYPLAVRRVRTAIERMEAKNLLGENILGSGRSLRLRIMEGAGAFVCGEETALLASIEGRRGTPRLRPPYPAESGLWGRATLINNIETFANVPWILRHGPAAYAATGTEHSKGTKVFALAGKITRGGLIEAPMGITIREIVETIGGGVPGGKAFKAVQIGGPSGGCVPARLADTPVDYESLKAVGAMMGSGGLVVLDEDDCMIDIARYFLQFTQDQSCGKCSFCRIGTRRMLEILDALCEGRARAEDIGTLEDLACAGWARPRRIPCSRRCDISARNTRPTSPGAARPGAAPR
jgi:NADH-quinone oxidoreductase subunit F